MLRVKVEEEETAEVKAEIGGQTEGVEEGGGGGKTIRSKRQKCGK